MSKYFDHTIYKFGTAKLINKHGKYYLHIPVTYDVEESNISDICNVVGIDRGINFVVATYDSNHKSGFVSGKAIKQKRANYSKLRKELQMRQTPSSRRRIKAIGGQMCIRDRYISQSHNASCVMLFRFIVAETVKMSSVSAGKYFFL